MQKEKRERRGYCISLEGGEGSGKSTVIRAIASHLEARGFKVLITREPGGVRIAERIREILLDREHTEMDARTEALLFAAARRQHFVEKILPGLERGAVVILDRFLDSSLVYQGFARGIGIEEVERINDFAILGFRPDLTLLLDVTPEVGMARISSNPEREVNKLDLEQVAFHRKVREGYHALLGRDGDRIVRIDADRGVEAVVADCIACIERRVQVEA
ncbi:MAG: dTMP kinase [Bacillota bacterium]|nr:dTMP kinase [Bacillota bacterium]